MLYFVRKFFRNWHLVMIQLTQINILILNNIPQFYHLKQKLSKEGKMFHQSIKIFVEYSGICSTVISKL